jgi:hypothetical protein
MLDWIWIGALLLYSAVNAVRLRADVGERYERFIYVCVLWFASIPIVLGDWVWSIVLLPLSLAFAPVMIRRHAADVRKSAL